MEQLTNPTNLVQFHQYISASKISNLTRFDLNETYKAPNIKFLVNQSNKIIFFIIKTWNCKM